MRACSVLSWRRHAPREGSSRIGVRLGNWLTPEQGRRLVTTSPATLRERRDHVMLAMLIGCGLHRGDLLVLQLDAIQPREDHRVIADLAGKAGHVRTVPTPGWVRTGVALFQFRASGRKSTARGGTAPED